MFDQSSYQCKLEWGKRGARAAANRGDIVIIVDVLSFSSTVVSAVNYGAVILPYPPHLDGNNYANQMEAEFILGRTEASKAGKPTLSPVTFSSEHANKRYVLSSTNGSYCTWLASQVPAVIIGSLLNATAVAKVASEISEKEKSNISVIACGERWGDTNEHEESLRFAIEDYLGAGAILSDLMGDKSPEANVGERAFQSSIETLKELVWDCGSGRELRHRGFAKDVKYCSQLNTFQAVPILDGPQFIDVKNKRCNR